MMSGFQCRRSAAFFGKSKPDKGGPPTAAVAGCFGEAFYLGVAGQQAVDAVALDAATASVNEANFSKAFFDGGFQVTFDDVRDLSRSEEMEIDRLFDRNYDRVREGAFGIRVGHGLPWVYLLDEPNGSQWRDGPEASV